MYVCIRLTDSKTTGAIVTRYFCKIFRVIRRRFIAIVIHLPFGFCTIIELFYSSGRVQPVYRIKIWLYHRNFINQDISIHYTYTPSSVNLSNSQNRIEIHSAVSEFIPIKKKKKKKPLHFKLCIDYSIWIFHAFFFM